MQSCRQCATVMEWCLAMCSMKYGSLSSILRIMCGDSGVMGSLSDVSDFTCSVCYEN